MSETPEPESEALTALNAEMETLQATIASAHEELVPFNSVDDEIMAAQEEARKAYEETARILRERKRINEQNKEVTKQNLYAAQQASWNIKNKIENEKREIERLRKEAEAAARKKAQEEDALLLNARWDKLTMTATWREWAKDHQISAGHYLTENRNVILADPMGLGKTLSSIVTCDMALAATKDTSEEFPFLGEEMEVYKGNGEWANEIVNSIKRPVGRKIIYLCPSSLIRNVVSEFKMWAKHRSVIFIGDMPKASKHFALDAIAERNDFVVVCNYEAWRRDKELIDKMISLNPDTIILDEAHTVKNMKSNAHEGVQKLITWAKPEYVIPMTGTPVLNRPQELFTLLNLVNPTKFHTENDFLYNFCEQIPDTNYWKFQDGGLDRLQKQIGKNFLRRTREQAGIILPEKTVLTHTLEVDKEAYPNQARVRQEMAKFATIKLNENDAIAATAVIAMYTRLRQIETWPAGIKMIDKNTKEVVLQVDVEESQKVDYAISNEPDEFGNYTGLIPEGIEDDRFVLFSQFKAPLHEIKRRVENAGYRAVIMDGSTSQSERDDVAKDFDARYTPDRSKSRWDIVLCNYRVGGVGLNLTAASQLIVLDEEWNPGKREQAYDRIHRMGQENAVTIHLIRNEKTIDDWLADIMSRKEAMVDGFNSTMSNIDDFKNFLDNGGLM